MYYSWPLCHEQRWGLNVPVGKLDDKNNKQLSILMGNSPSKINDAYTALALCIYKEYRKIWEGKMTHVVIGWHQRIFLGKSLTKIISFIHSVRLELLVCSFGLFLWRRHAAFPSTVRSVIMFFSVFIIYIPIMNQYIYSSQKRPGHRYT